MEYSILLDRIRDLTRPLSPISVDHDTKLKKLEGISCVAFDFYGTMFISGVGDIGVDEEQQVESSAHFLQALKSTGFTVLKEKAGKKGVQIFEETVSDYISEAQANGIDHPEPEIRSVWLEVLQQLADQKFISGDLDQRSANHFGVEFEFRINDVWPVPNLENVLTTLRDRGITLGIISNSQFYTPIAFEAFLEQSPESFGFHPNLLVWSFKVGRKKPSKQFYSKFVDAAAQENIKPGEVLYVGNDIRKDIAPAKALGMHTALYIGDKRSIRHEPKELEKKAYKPDLVINDLNQIVECLSF